MSVVHVANLGCTFVDQTQCNAVPGDGNGALYSRTMRTETVTGHGTFGAHFHLHRRFSERSLSVVGVGATLPADGATGDREW